MIVLNKEEFLNTKRKNFKKMKESIFIYPTDSIYGIGCDATKPELVDQIRKLKKSNLQPFSIIVPSKEWVKKNCVINKEQEKYFEALGTKIDMKGEKHAFTLILKLKNKDAVAKNVTQGTDTIGIRMPDNWFSEIVSDLDFPIITTSANPTGENFMTSLEDLNDSIKHGVEFIIYEGEKKGVPSTIINLVLEEPKIIPRK